MRVHNFGAGPCTLPLDVLEEAREEFLEFSDSGMSLLELSHRSPTYDEVHSATLELARRVAGAPADFEVLLMQGGATLQFAMLPMNLLGPGSSGGYVVSGAWGAKALASARKAGVAYSAWDGVGYGFTRMPAPEEIRLDDGTRYLHVTTNETIGGIRMVDFPESGTPLVADMSSEYLTRPIEWDRYDVVYGGVQKNLGPAGLALVFVRRSAIEDGPDLPDFLAYRWHAAANSLGNTPAMFQIYLMGKVLRRIEGRGGVPVLEAETEAKASMLYAAIDESDGFFTSPIDRAVRSLTNVVFRLPSPELEARFLLEAAHRNLVGLKGHRSVGGCRASLYAALELDSVSALVDHMRTFQRDAR